MTVDERMDQLLNIDFMDNDRFFFWTDAEYAEVKLLEKLEQQGYGCTEYDPETQRVIISERVTESYDY